MSREQQFVDFHAVKAVVTMEQVLDHYGLTQQLTRKGDTLNGPCPIHNGKNPTQFRVSLSKNCWNCFGECKHGGNVLDFVSRMEPCDLLQAAHRLIEWFSLSIGEAGLPSNAQARKGPPMRVSPRPTSPPEELGTNNPLGFTLKDLDASHPYLAERGLTSETIAEFGLGLCNAGTMIGRIAIPIHNPRGDLVGYIGRWPGDPPKELPKYKLPKGFKKSVEVFNLHRAIKEAGPLIIVEGVFDVMKLWQLGARKVIALMGSSLSSAQEQLIVQSTNVASQIIVMFDEDDAGRAGRADVLCSLATKVFVLVVPFATEGQQPEHLTAEELHDLLGGAHG
jgi:DNA primase